MEVKTVSPLHYSVPYIVARLVTLTYLILYAYNTRQRNLAVLRKHRNELNSEAVQQVLGIDELGAELLGVFRKRVEAVSNMIVRRVKVNRTREPQAMLDATGRKQYTDRNVVKNMPHDGREEDDVFFFKPDKSAYDRNNCISDDNLTKEYDLRGLKPDPYAQAAVNEADSAFADDHPNGTHWKDADGNWCYAAFLRWDGVERRVDVRRSRIVWDGRWLFAGVRK